MRFSAISAASLSIIPTEGDARLKLAIIAARLKVD
jgi:hypothetical protein